MKNIFKLSIAGLILISCFYLINCGSVQEPSEYNQAPSSTESVGLATTAEYQAYYNTVFLTANGIHWPTVDDSTSSTYNSPTGIFFQKTGLLYKDNKVVVYGGKSGALRKFENLIANLACDGMFYNAKMLDIRCQMYFTNAGGVRDDKTVGTTLIGSNPYLTPGDTISPIVQSGIFFYSNFLEVMKVKGRNLKDMFELGVAEWTNKTTGIFAGKFGHMAGAKIEVDRTKIKYPDSGYGRITKIMLYTNTADTKVWDYDYSDTTKWTTVYDSAAGGWVAPYTVNSEFYIGTSNYLTLGGDDYTMLYYAKLKEDGFVATDGRLMSTLFGEYIYRYKQVKGSSATIMPVMQERVKFVD